MVQQASQQAPPAFPTPTESLKFGWEFFRTNVWTVVVLLGVSAGVAALASPFLDSDDDSSATGWQLLVAFAIISVGLVVELGVWRRVLDYWDEVNGRVAPRSTGDALKAAFDGARQRFWPYLGWIFVLALAIAAPLLVVFALVDPSPLAALVVLLVVLAGIYVVDFLTAFFPIAAADGPGNPITKSFHVFGGHFWRIVGTYLLFGAILLGAAIPVAILVVIFDGSTAATVIQGIGTAILAVIFRGLGAGAKSVMYRAVYPPASEAT